MHFSPVGRPQCKIMPFAEFQLRTHWLIDRWWTQAEQLALGLADEPSVVSADEFQEGVRELQEQLASLGNITGHGVEQVPFQEVSLADSNLFTLAIGKRVLKKDIVSEGIPVYSANVSAPFGYLPESNVTDFSCPALLMGH